MFILQLEGRINKSNASKSCAITILLENEAYQEEYYVAPPLQQMQA